MSSLKFSTKRSLSESSADEIYNKANVITKKGGRQQNMWRNELVITPNSPVKQNNLSRDQKHQYSNWIDIGIRIALVIVFIKLETTAAFTRKIQMEELWLYKNPRTPDYVSPAVLLSSVILAPLGISLLHFIISRNRRDFNAASWTWTLILCFNGLATSLLKITVGRPRPDFFYRCFPDGVMVLNNVTGLEGNGTAELFNCTGSVSDINEGRKSFPSGHSSFAFASYGFLTYYIGAKLHAFSGPGRGQTWRLCISITPLLLAALVAVSRTCDYHHHGQDVFVGSLIGLVVSYMVYRQYYPSIFDENCDRPYKQNVYCYDLKLFRNESIKRVSEPKTNGIARSNNEIESCEDDSATSTNDNDHRSLLSNDKGKKWLYK